MASAQSFGGGALPPVPYAPPIRSLSKSERRRSGAEIFYELETGFREDDWPSEDFVYDAEHDLYRFVARKFTFSKYYANERRLREMGLIG